MAAPYAASRSSRRKTPRRTSCSKSPSTGARVLNHIVGDITMDRPHASRLGRFRGDIDLEEIAGGMPEPVARARQHRHHGAHRHAHDAGDLLVGKAFQLAQDQDFSKPDWKLA